MSAKTTWKDVVITSGGTVSAACDIPDGYTPIGFYVAAFTGASLTFQASPDGGTNFVATDSAAVTVTAAKICAIPEAAGRVLAGFQKMKVVSAGAEGADRTVRIFFRDIESPRIC